MGKKLIYFVRHGESEQNAQGIRQGPDGPLSEGGRAQALEAAQKFPHDKGRPQIIYASPYQRTKETAEIIGKELGLKIKYSDLLVERRNPSVVVGKPGSEKNVRQVIDRIDKSFHEDDLRYADEENFIDLKKRAKRLLKFIAGRRQKRIIMVTHGLFLRMVVAYMLHGKHLSASEYNALSFYNPIDNAGLTICLFVPHWFKKNEWKILSWNNK
jgi:broad specificity phosphatase PhoE